MEVSEKIAIDPSNVKKLWILKVFFFEENPRLLSFKVFLLEAVTDEGGETNFRIYGRNAVRDPCGTRFFL